MATLHEQAEAHVARLMRDAREHGSTAYSHDWGGGQNKRFVGVTYDPAARQYHATLVAWGVPAREITGRWLDVHTECVLALVG